VSEEQKRALVTGGTGQLGREMVQTAPPGWCALAFGSAALDVTRAEAVADVLERVGPAVVINAAAYTAVDAAEAEPDRAHAVNAVGAANVAEACRRVGARLIQVSTDYVFDGTATRPYRPDDEPRPLGVYGTTKLAGEAEVIRLLGDEAVILRTAWLYSRWGRNFVLTMLRLLEERDQVAVVQDQVGAPTWSRSLAEAIWAAAARPELRGIYHWTDEGVTSWYDFAVAIQRDALELGLVRRRVPIRPLRTDQYPTAARRPPYSVLDATRTETALRLSRRPWGVSLHLMLQDLAGA
jgi:dTDP-4-dehydrorhamnose reductase